MESSILLIAIGTAFCAIGSICAVVSTQLYWHHQKLINRRVEKALEEIDADLDTLFDESNGKAAEDLPKNPAMSPLFREIISKMKSEMERDLGSSFMVNGMPSTKVFNSLDEFLTFMHERHPEAFTECKSCGQKH